MNTVVVSKFKNFKFLISELTLFEIVFTCVLSVAMGVAYWGWTFFYELSVPLLKLVGLNYLSSGFWLFIGIFLPLIIRRPFVALFASVIAAGVEGFITHWGLMAFVWGFVQGLGAEIVFMSYSYKKWDASVLYKAAVLSATLSYVLDYFFYDYAKLVPALQLTQYFSFVISACVLAAFLSLKMANRLNKLNLLSQFLISKST